MAKSTLWIVTPCYFDVPSFQKLRADVSANIANLPQYSARFVLIDDSAGLDPRISEASSLSDVKIISPPFNLGHQRAIVYGLRHLLSLIKSDDVVITMDSDGEDRPADIPSLLSALISSPDREKIVLARRTKRKVSIKFRVMYAAFVLLFRTLTGKILRSGNFACIPGHTVKNVISHPFFDLCYSSTLVNIKIPVISVPCERGPRYFDQSKMGYFNLIMHGFRMLMPFVDHIAMRAIIVSGIMASLSVISGLILFVIQVMGMTAISNWYLLASLISFIISVLFVGLFLLLFTVFAQLQSSVLTKIDP